MASFEKLRILIFWANLHKFLLWNFYAENFQTYQAFCWNEFKSIAIRQRLLKCSAYVNWEIWMKLKIKIPHSIKQSNRIFWNGLALKSNYLMTVNIFCILMEIMQNTFFCGSWKGSWTTTKECAEVYISLNLHNNDIRKTNKMMRWEHFRIQLRGAPKTNFW